MAPELDIEGILEALVEADVEFLLIGGVAVGFHGYVRATKDVDVVPSPDPDNLNRLARVLGQLDAEVEGAGEFEDGELPDPLDPDVLALGGNWVLNTRLISVPVVGYEDLVALKREAGRPEDLADLRRLSQARGDGPKSLATESALTRSLRRRERRCPDPG